MSAQVEKLCTKFRQKVWAIRRLRKAGFNETELIKLYKSYIRPTIEYSGPIYHSMLTAEQDALIERQQFFALKNVYGFHYSHRRLLELFGLQTEPFNSHIIYSNLLLLFHTLTLCFPCGVYENFVKMYCT